MRLTLIEATQSPEHDWRLKEKLRPNEELEERWSLNEELVSVVIDIEVLEAEHEAWDYGWWINCLEVHDCPWLVKVRVTQIPQLVDNYIDMEKELGSGKAGISWGAAYGRP